MYISGTRQVRYVIPENSKKKDVFRYKVRLPPYLTCSQCVLQWTYYTGELMINRHRRRLLVVSTKKCRSRNLFEITAMYYAFTTYTTARVQLFEVLYINIFPLREHFYTYSNCGRFNCVSVRFYTISFPISI